MAAASEIVNIDTRRHATELRETWQGRLLGWAITVHDGVAKPNSPLGMCILSVLAHNYDDAMQVLLALHGARGVGTPMLTSAAKIAKNGHVMADFVGRDGIKFKNQNLFNSTKRMEGTFRRLADAMRLTDAERIELFAAVKRWVVCDFRLDPTMNPADPDARRLTVH